MALASEHPSFRTMPGSFRRMYRLHAGVGGPVLSRTRVLPAYDLVGAGGCCGRGGRGPEGACALRVAPFRLHIPATELHDVAHAVADVANLVPGSVVIPAV